MLKRSPEIEGLMEKDRTCIDCGGSNLFKNSAGVSGANGYAANYLPGLGGFLYGAKLYPVVCQDCGLVRFYTDEDARSKLSESKYWERLGQTRPD